MHFRVQVGGREAHFSLRIQSGCRVRVAVYVLGSEDLGVLL